MSLVVAMIEQDRIHLNADLRVTRSTGFMLDAKKVSPHFFNGVLKVIPINPHIAIAYAGMIGIALKVIRSFKGSKLSSAEIARSIVELMSAEGNLTDCDFLIIDAVQMQIHKIKNGEITTISNGRTWIGDVDAYEIFQQKLDELGFDDAPNPIAKSSVMMNALDAVIQDEAIESVGEYPIAVFNYKGELQLSVGFQAYGRGLGFSNDMNDDSIIINLTVPVERGIAAVGLYIVQFERGALYLPLIQDEAFIVHGKTVGEFRANVLKDYGIELLGGGFE